MRKIASIVKDHLENPDIIWELDQYTLRNRTYRYELWIANNRMNHLDIYSPMKIVFTKEEREILNPLVDAAIETIFLKLVESKKMTTTKCSYIQCKKTLIKKVPNQKFCNDKCKNAQFNLNKNLNKNLKK